MIFFCEAANETAPVEVVESNARPVKDIAEVPVYQAAIIEQRVTSQRLLRNLNGFKSAWKQLAREFDKLHVCSHILIFSISKALSKL